MSQNLDSIHSTQCTISLERDAIDSLLAQIGDDFVKACELLLTGEGRVVAVDIGKFDHIGKEIATTLTSTGTPSFFMHPVEASHGDMGMITKDDVVLALSNSDSAAEIVALLPLIKCLGITLISIIGSPESPLAKAAEMNLDASVGQEACPPNLAPTSSTTVTLVPGDTLAITLLGAHGFTTEDFAFSYPGGALGRQLLLKVEGIVHVGKELPWVLLSTSLTGALMETTRKGPGMIVVLDEHGKLAGIFTDGGLRRALDRDIDVRQVTIDQVMTIHDKAVCAGILATEALRIMGDNEIDALMVVDTDNRPVGALNIRGLLRVGVM